MTKLAQRIATDAAGLFLIIIAVPIGWLPGPGGIPLIIIGLSLLAKNNQWARGLLDNFEIKFRYYSNRVMHTDPRLQALLDIAGLSLLGLGVYFFTQKGGTTQLTATALITASLILLLLNRGRGDRLYDKIRRKKT